MQMRKVLGLAAIGALLVVAAPTERAQAVSVSSPGAATAVQENAKQTTTDVHWRRHRHHGWHRHHRWHGHHRSPPPLVSARHFSASAKQAREQWACFRFSHETGMIARRYRPSGSMAGDGIMKGWIGAAFVAGVLVLAGPASAETSAVAPQATKQAAGTAKATDVSARHAGLPLRLSAGLPALPLLLRAALLLPALSLQRAGTVHVRLRVWTVLVMSDESLVRCPGLEPGPLLSGRWKRHKGRRLFSELANRM